MWPRNDYFPRSSNPTKTTQTWRHNYICSPCYRSPLLKKDLFYNYSSSYSQPVDLQCQILVELPSRESKSFLGPGHYRNIMLAQSGRLVGLGTTAATDIWKCKTTPELHQRNDIYKKGRTITANFLAGKNPPPKKKAQKKDGQTGIWTPDLSQFCTLCEAKIIPLDHLPRVSGWVSIV